MVALIAFGIFIVLALTLVAVYFQWKLYQKKSRDNALRLTRQIEAAERVDKNRKSIEILVLALEQDQMSLTEGAIRISVILNAMGYQRDKVGECEAFYRLADETAHMPILDKWSALPKKKKQELTRERELIEKEHYASIRRACDALKRHKDFFLTPNSTTH